MTTAPDPTGRSGLPLSVRRNDTDQDAADSMHAGQILDGAKRIAEYLALLGFTEMTPKLVFCWASDGRLPVKKIGSRLVTTKRALHGHFGLESYNGLTDDSQ